ncbi:hypothetical protein CRG98_005347 [Punica granatum]|uniref:G-patch domain-containing protein n=1 Tax=Punica granatum TaxID=22663 RepID=A0A2I0L237_PUNGR|nr:hypothetical protein CRG98_005347 [Punica granatum]
MIGKVLMRHNYIPGTGLGARGQGINRPIEVEAYKHRRGLGFRPSCHEIIEARRGNHLHRLATHYGRLYRGIPVPPLSHFFPGPPLIIGSTSDGPSSDFDDATDTLLTVYAVTEEIPSGVHIRPAQEDEELNNWTSVLRYSAVIADVLHSNLNPQRVDSNPPEECLGEPGPVYFGEGLDEDSLVPEIEESLRRLEDRQLTSLEPTEEINVGTQEEPRILKIGTSLDPTQRVRMIDFLTRYQEVFAWSYADMPGLDLSITLGQWKTKDAKRVPYHEYLEKLTENFEDISFTYTPRMTNQFADALATLASMAVLPIEVEIPSMRILAKAELEEAEWAKQWYEQLNFIDEKRLKALCHGQCYQQRMARAFNARVRHRDFNPGDLVLRKVLHVTPDSRGKFSYKYDGPFVVKEVNSEERSS